MDGVRKDGVSLAGAAARLNDLRGAMSSGGADYQTIMRKITAGMFIALDGVVEAPDQWHFPYFNDEMGAAVGGQLGAADTILLGRKTYDSFAGAWPDREAGGDEDAEFAKKLGDTRKIVMSRQNLQFTWLGVAAVGEPGGLCLLRRWALAGLVAFVPHTAGVRAAVLRVVQSLLQGFVESVIQQLCARVEGLDVPHPWGGIRDH